MVNLSDYFSQFNLERVSFDAKFIQADFSFQQSDRDAAWELYVELLTRVSTQHIAPPDGDEVTALRSIYSLFPITRQILRARGKSCINFSKVAIPVLNQVVRPFTAKWHGREVRGAFDSPEEREEFRRDLSSLQSELRNYNRMLANIAGVEDLTSLSSDAGAPKN